MIEASVGAVPGLVPAFVIITLLLAVPVGLLAKSRGRSAVLPVLFTTALAGVLTVTLMPGFRGAEAPGTCDRGLPGTAFLASESAQLNVLLFVPLCFLAILLFRRPVFVLAGTVLLTSGIELAQGHLPLGRACSYDDVKANALGGIIGLSLGCLCRYLFPRDGRRRSPFTRRDTLWGLGAVVASACAVATAFPGTLTIEDFEATTYRSKAALGNTDAMREWFAGTVTELLGAQANGGTMMRKPENSRQQWLLRADTDHGSVVATWPGRKLLELRTPSHQREAGGPARSRALPEAELRKSAERFARTWFPTETAGADARFEYPANEPDTRLLGYRHYDHGVVTPMRIDIAVSTTGRITGLTTKALPGTQHALEPTAAPTPSQPTQAVEDDGREALGRSRGGLTTKVQVPADCRPWMSRRGGCAPVTARTTRRRGGRSLPREAPAITRVVAATTVARAWKPDPGRARPFIESADAQPTPSAPAGGSPPYTRSLLLDDGAER